MGVRHQKCTGLGNLCMCVYTSMCAYVCACLLCMCVYAYPCVSVCVCLLCMCMYIYPCVYVCLHTQVCMCACISTVHMCVCIPMCACVCVCMSTVHVFQCVHVYVWRRPGQRKSVGKQAKHTENSSVVLSVKAG